MDNDNLFMVKKTSYTSSTRNLDDQDKGQCLHRKICEVKTVHFQLKILNIFKRTFCWLLGSTPQPLDLIHCFSIYYYYYTTYLLRNSARGLAAPQQTAATVYSSSSIPFPTPQTRPSSGWKRGGFLVYCTNESSCVLYSYYRWCLVIL